MLGSQHRGKFNSESERKEVTYLKTMKKITIIRHFTSLSGQTSYLFPICWGADQCSYCCFSYVEAHSV